MHVGYSLLTLFPGRVGGSETNARGLLEEFRAGNGPERVTVLANRHVADAYSRYAGGPVSLHHVRSYRAGDSMPTRALAMGFARLAPRLVARDVPRDFDVVHFPVTVPIPRTSRPEVVTLFDVQHLDMPEFFSRSERRYRRWAYEGAARRATLVITSSAYSKERLVESAGVDPGRVEVVHLGIDHELFTPDGSGDEARLDGLGLPERFVVYPANMWPHKNHERLIEAFARVEADDLALVLTGQPYGRLERVMGLARRRGIGDRVLHLGYLERAAAARALPWRSGDGLPKSLRGLRHAAARGDGLRAACGRVRARLTGRDLQRCCAALRSGLAGGNRGRHRAGHHGCRAPR